MRDVFAHNQSERHLFFCRKYYRSSFPALEIILTLHIRNDRILLTQDMVLRRLNNKRFIQNVDDIKSIKFDKGQKNILSSENMGKDE